MKNLLTAVLSFVYVLIYSQSHFEFGTIPLLGSTHLYTSNTEVCKAIENDYHISAHVEKLTYWEATGGESDPDLATHSYLHLYKYDQLGNVIEKKSHRISTGSVAFQVVKILKIDTMYHVYLNRYSNESFSGAIGSEVFVSDTDLDKVSYNSVRFNFSTRDMISDVLDVNGALYIVFNAFYNNDTHCHFIKTSYSYVSHWAYKIHEGFEFRKLSTLNNRIYIVGNRANNVKIIDFDILSLTPTFTLYDYPLPFVTDKFIISSHNMYGANVLKLVTGTDVSNQIYRYFFINPNTIGNYLFSNRVNMSFAGQLRVAYVLSQDIEVFSDVNGYRVDLEAYGTHTIRRYPFPFYKPLATTFHSSGTRDHYHSASLGFNYGYNNNYRCTNDSIVSMVSTVYYGSAVDYSPVFTWVGFGQYESQLVEFDHIRIESFCTWPKVIDASLDRVFVAADVSISPNPFFQEFEVIIPNELSSYGENELIVYNLMGCAISKQAINSDRVRVNLEGASSGVYIVKFGNIIKKIIKN